MQVSGTLAAFRCGSSGAAGGVRTTANAHQGLAMQRRLYDMSLGDRIRETLPLERLAGLAGKGNPVSHRSGARLLHEMFGADVDRSAKGGGKKRLKPRCVMRCLLTPQR